MKKYDIIKQLVSATSELPDDTQGRIFRAAVKYLETGVESQLDTIENTVFKCFRPRFDEIMEYEKRVSVKRAASGKKGGRPKKKNEKKTLVEISDENIEKVKKSKKSNCFLTAENNVENDGKLLQEEKFPLIKEIFPPITPYKENITPNKEEPAPKKDRDIGDKGKKEEEKNGEEHGEISDDRPDPDKRETIPYQRIVDMWNSTCTNFHRLTGLGDERRIKLAVRYRELARLGDPVEQLQILFDKMQSSMFLQGDNNRGWKASFDWLIQNDKNWRKVMEGNYEKENGYENTCNNAARPGNAGYLGGRLREPTEADYPTTI